MLIPALARWPWHILFPLLCYLAAVLSIGPLRRSIAWLRIGRLDGAVILGTGAIIALSSSALVLYYALFRPDLEELRTYFGAATGMELVLIGIGFSVLNATQEEIVFRGILTDGLEAESQPLTALVVQALAFGAAHYHGYPPGPVGVVLASIYGLMLGVLRSWAGGLAAPIIAHAFADATIFVIVVTT
jgi:membrane protease YdiL (CAAX protease family)